MYRRGLAVYVCVCVVDYVCAVDYGKSLHVIYVPPFFGVGPPYSSIITMLQSRGHEAKFLSCLSLCDGPMGSGLS